MERSADTMIADMVVRLERDAGGKEIALVDCDGVRLVCHHPREGIWCCCAAEGHAQCRCAYTLDAAVRAWCRDDELGE
ncbi:MAG TPA: hypothetical protein VGM69_07935 [Chloroflexota bacterium]|jgi:hypothetical protein